MITWMKVGNPGLGQYFRGLTEHCLFGVKGKLPYKVKEDGKRGQGKTGFITPRGNHSEKSEILREWIQMVSQEPYIELFARKQTEKWDVWGNEVNYY